MIQIFDASGGQLKNRKDDQSKIRAKVASLSLRAWKRAGVKSKEALEFISRTIDYLFIPVAIYYNRKGFNFFEVKVSALGHHLFEPVAIALINKKKNKCDQKKLTLLASRKDALVPYTNEILKQQFNIIDNYSFLNIEYWLARNTYCGISRNSNYKVFMDAHYKYRKELNIFNLDYLEEDHSVQELAQYSNPDQRYIVMWKPRCYRSEKHYPSRYSGIESIKTILDRIYEDGGIVYGLLYGAAKLVHQGLFDLRDISDDYLREKFVYYLDYKCRYAITGQTGGGVPQLIFLKPILAYDLALPYSLHFSGPKTIIAPKQALYRDGSPVDIKTLLNLKNEKEVDKLKINFINNTENDMTKLHLELLNRMKNYPVEFCADSYAMNRDWGNSIPRNIYNSYGYSQVADYSYIKNKASLYPPWKNSSLLI